MRRMYLPKARIGKFTIHELLNHHNDLTRAWGVFAVGDFGFEQCVAELPTLAEAVQYAEAR